MPRTRHPLCRAVAAAFVAATLGGCDRGLESRSDGWLLHAFERPMTRFCGAYCRAVDCGDGRREADAWVPFFIRWAIGEFGDRPIPYCEDGDSDEVPAVFDDCPGVANADQVDTDDDGLGDVCDACPESAGAECDECAASRDDCDPLVECVDTPDGFDCGSCPSGYTDVNGDGTLCENVDECVAEPCDPLVDCVDTPGSFECGPCPEGYADVNGDGSQCEEIDACADSGCPFFCDAVSDGFACRCPPGYADVNGDGTVCEDVDLEVPAGPKKFSASVSVLDQIDGASRMSPPVTLYYQDGAPKRGDQWIRLDVAASTGEIQEFHRYGGFDNRFIYADGRCNRFPLFDFDQGSGPHEVATFPQLYGPGGHGEVVHEDLTLADGTKFFAGSVKRFETNGAELFVDEVSGAPLRAIYELNVFSNEPVVRQIDFVGSFDGSGAFDSAETFQPASLFEPNGSDPPVCFYDPSCERIDVVFVLDGSGSMSAEWQTQIRYVFDLLSTAFNDINSNRQMVGYQVFRTKAFQPEDLADDPDCCGSIPRTERLDLTPNQNTFETALNTLDSAYPFDVGDTTHGGLVDGLRVAFEQLKELGRHDRFARQIVVVFTDSAGSSPCCTQDELSLDDLDAGVSWESYLCSNTACEAKHDAYVTALYDRIDAALMADPDAFDPDVLVLGVGSAADLDPTIALVARVGSRQLADEPETAMQRIASWSDLAGLEQYGGLLRDALDPVAQCGAFSPEATNTCPDDCITQEGGAGYCCRAQCGVCSP